MPGLQTPASASYCHRRPFDDSAAATAFLPPELGTFVTVALTVLVQFFSLPAPLVSFFAIFPILFLLPPVCRGKLFKSIGGQHGRGFVLCSRADSNSRADSCADAVTNVESNALASGRAELTRGRPQHAVPGGER